MQHSARTHSHTHTHHVRVECVFPLWYFSILIHHGPDVGMLSVLLHVHTVTRQDKGRAGEQTALRERARITLIKQ